MRDKGRSGDKVETVKPDRISLVFPFFTGKLADQHNVGLENAWYARDGGHAVGPRVYYSPVARLRSNESTANSVLLRRWSSVWRLVARAFLC